LDSSAGEYKKTDLDNVQAIADSTMSLSKSLINDLSKITANLSTTQGYTQTTVNSYRNSISNAGDLIAVAASELNTTKTAMNTAENSYLLDKSGSTANDLNAQNAAVMAAEADVLNAQAQLSKSIIVAPFDGVITKMEARVGEIASANASNISINSLDTFIIKSNVPEVYISNLSVGDSASTTLDAYGSSVSFPLVVTAIDPAQTVVNGVSNYKTTLQFVDKDQRIKPGMTANIDITTKNIPNSFIVPLGSIKNRDGKQYVQIRQNGEIVEREISTGAVSTVGEVQVLSGLNVNDQVILNPKTQ
jgi:HlyD family secretion protein